ncbi:hypothetical protein PRIPAC_94192 [Pristionchus pacificus]|uniref:Phosphatidylinositol-4,5-bisphosphate 4-phosphatase n=1 Tax=Pristionchus pacificus TaxID=54126 RepID=A0A2A6BJF8_PRIPA|nr:hypothetical protein PRIPAC_94192 [Pristionchus pacificus]|eukprot:PDM65956.1 hypothetical protein PRIPAC_44235 [Pristionchus pacificus]
MDVLLREVNEEAMADHSEENVPLLSANASAVVDHPMEEDLDDNGEQDEEEEEESSHRSISGTTVNCRVCDAVIQLEGRSLQHVVKCGACQEATPIRPAPPGKKYVRCPCNCLLICKASSTRIACPRQNCRRVITLGQSSSPGTAMQAPTGTCRVACAYCEDIFMFNTLSNALATCPHCRKESAVGGSYRRSRLIYFTSGLTLSLIFAFVFTALAFLTNAGTILETFFIISLTVLYALGAYCTFKALKFYLARISTIVAPV